MACDGVVDMGYAWTVYCEEGTPQTCNSRVGRAKLDMSLVIDGAVTGDSIDLRPRS